MLESILYLFILYLIIPCIGFIFLLIKKKEKRQFVTEFKKRLPVFGCLLVAFVCLSLFFNNQNALDDADGYQEESFVFIVMLFFYALYTSIFLVLIFRYFKSGGGNLYFRARSFFFNVLFYVSGFFFVLNLFSLFTCGDDPLMYFLSSLFSVLVLIISLFDLLISFLKSYFSFVLIFYCVGLFGYWMLLRFLVPVFDGDGECLTILGPDESGLFLTFGFIFLYSFLARRRGVELSEGRK